MNTLSSALSNALSGLLVSSAQTAVISKNVTRAGDADYTRRDIGLSINYDGTAKVGAYTRSADKTLLDKTLQSASLNGGLQVTLDALGRLSQTIGDPQDGQSVAAGLTQLQQAMQDFANNPANTAFASQSVEVARDLASRLNRSAGEIESMRNEAHQSIVSSISKVNELLGELQGVDSAIRAGNPGTEVQLDLLDRRDAILKRLSEELPIRVVDSSGGGVSVYTDGGVTLFDKIPRSVELRPGLLHSPGNPGPQLVIDNVQVTGSNAPLALREGRLAGHFAVRDGIAESYQGQLDEVARRLVEMFAETPQGTPPQPPSATGLFIHQGSPAVPAAGVRVPGLASMIAINPLFDPQANGNALLLRDGGSNGAAYLYNTAGHAGFQQRLFDLASSFDQDTVFDPATGFASTASVKSFATQAASGVEAERANTSRRQEAANAVHQRSNEALLRKTGVNIDVEMATLLTLEKSYQASAKVMSAVDQMFGVLVGIVR